MLRLALAVAHLLGLAIGLGAVHARARALRAVPRAPDALGRALVADNWWGVSAILLLGTGVWRAVAGTEKSPGYYWPHGVFHLKLALVGAILLLELWPMATLVRWRLAAGRGRPPTLDAATTRRLALVSDVQSLLVVAIVVAAVALARGYALPGR